VLHLRYATRAEARWMAQAYLHAGAVAAALALLLASAVLGLVYQRRSLRLAARLHEGERMAALGELSAVMAHEIRNPLAAVKGHAQFALEDIPEDAPVREGLEVIVSEATRLEGLVRSLLDYARPRALAARWVEAAEPLRGALRTRHPEFVQRGVSARLDPGGEGLEVWADPDALEQALHNLVGNALDVLDDVADPTIVLGACADGAGHALVFVQDNGPGVPPEVASRIFDPYVTRRARGTGLGLAVVRQVAEGLGGSVRLGRAPGRGARFEIRLRSRSRPGPRQEETA